MKEKRNRNEAEQNKKYRNRIDITSWYCDDFNFCGYDKELSTCRSEQSRSRRIAKRECRDAKELAEFEGISEELANALGKLEEGDLETLLEQLHNAENEVNSYEYMDDIVIVYNIGLENWYNNTARCLTYGCATDENNKTHSVKRTSTEEWDYAVNSLKLDLKESIDEELEGNVEDKYIYLVFSVDMTKIYADDYNDVEKVLTDFETRYGDKVRYRLNILEGE